MRYPEFLKTGGTIGFAALSYGCTIEPYKSGFEAAKKRFAEMGYKTFTGENCSRSDGIGISSSPESCGRELTDMYAGDECDVIISCGGGELMCEILPFVDFGKIKKAKPKWFLGYSDNTNFTFTSAVLADTAAVYGPCAPTFGMRQWHRALEDTWGVMTGKSLKVEGYDKWEMESLKTPENPFEPYNLTEDKQLVLRTGKEAAENLTMEGRMIGGCLDTLLTLIGTPYDKVKEFIQRYKDDGIVWFLEACDLSVYQIRRGLWQMKQAGWFEGVTGFLFGRPMHFDEPEGVLDRHLAVTSQLEDLGVPIIMDGDLGHLPPAVPVITGAIGRMTADKKNLHLEMLCK